MQSEFIFAIANIPLIEKYRKMSRIQRFIWFIQRPSLYPEIVRKIKRNLGALIIPSLRTHTAKARWGAKKEAIKWCEKNSIDTKEAILEITGLEQFESFSVKFQEQLKTSEEIAQKSPFEWSNYQAANLEMLYQLSEYIQAEKIIETGVAYGWSSLALLLSLKNRDDSTLISTELPPVIQDSEKYVGCVVPLELKSHWKIIMSADREALPQALKMLPTIDMCHYDSDKFYESRLWAYPRLWNALRPGGLFISDDVEDDFGFRDFCNSIEQNPLIIKSKIASGFKYVGVLIKPN